MSPEFHFVQRIPDLCPKHGTQREGGVCFECLKELKVAVVPGGRLIGMKEEDDDNA